MLIPAVAKGGVAFGFGFGFGFGFELKGPWNEGGRGYCDMT